MNEITINIKDYIDESEIKEIVKEEVRSSIRRNLETWNDLEVFYTNVSYYEVRKYLNEHMALLTTDTTKDINTLIFEKIKEIINNFNVWDVFREENKRFGDEKSEGQKLLDNACLDCKDMIYSKVKEVAQSINYEKHVDNVFEDVLADVIKEKLFGKE